MEAESTLLGLIAGNLRKADTVSNMDALGRYKWIFIALAAGMLGYGFFAAYRKPVRQGTSSTTCEACDSRRQVRVALWIGTVLAVCGVIFGYVEPYLKISPR